MKMKSPLAIALLTLGLLASNALAASGIGMDRRWVQAEPEAITPTPLAPGPHPLGQLKPWLECISKAPGTITAYFGFENPTTEDIGVPVGPNNKFVPDPINRSQTTNFLSGRSRYFPVYAFSVTIGSNAQASWQLNGYQVTANAESALCETTFVQFQMIVDAPPPLPAPSQSQVDALAQEAATQMGTNLNQIATSVNSVGLGKYQIVFNVTGPAEGEGGVSPVQGVTILFGDNVKFSAFVDRAILLGLAPSLVEPLPTGKEVEGEPIGGGGTTPSATTPSSGQPSSQAPGSPNPSSSPSSSSPSSSSPNEPSSTSPNSSPDATPFAPTALNNPSSSASSTFVRNDVGISIMIALLVVVILYAACF